MGNKRRIYTILGALCILLVIIHVRRTKSNPDTTIKNTGWNVACLKPDTDIDGADQLLQGYYDIAYTPLEGGRCYFAFTKDEKVKFANPRTVSHMDPPLNSYFSYNQTGNQRGTTAYFTDNTYRELINLLNSPTKASYEIFGGIVVDSPQLIEEALAIESE